MFDIQNLTFDLNDDGIVDTVLLDTSGDGIVDTIVSDFNNDGITDIYSVDTDGNGTFETIGVDSNSDGVIDMVMVDINDDGSTDITTTFEDINGDDILDELTDTNGDGNIDSAAISVDVDGNGLQDGVWESYDTDGDGVMDTNILYVDTNNDGQIDYVVKSYDYNGDGIIDTEVAYQDIDNDGIFDVVTKSYDSDGDTQIDTFQTSNDADGDGKEDFVTLEQFIDTDGDEIPDTYIIQTDADGNGVYDAAEVYSFDAVTGAIELLTVEDLSTYEFQEWEQFDPELSNPEDVIGDPAKSMEYWECQGDTNRCAVYSQMFVIEELSGQDIDVDELAALAENNGWFTEEGGTPFLNMNKLLDYYGVENEMSFNNDISDIQECLENGGKVIVSIDADEIWYGESNDLFSPEDGANHAVEVIGIDNSDPDNPMVILNDSAPGNGGGEMVPLDIFLDAWEDSNCQMIACM